MGVCPHVKIQEVRLILEYSLIAVVMVLIGLGVGYFLRKNIAEGKLNQAEQEAERIIANGERMAESKKKEALLEAKEEIHKLRSDVERENKERRSELQRMERRILQKEESLDKKLDNIEHKEEALHRKEADLVQSKEKIDALYEKQMAELERISGMTFEEARNILLTNVEQEIRHETAIMVKDMEQQAKDEAEKKAKEIISGAIQRCAADHVAETTVSVVALPNDEMKGRIIGREGRNIRALEAATGVEIVVDDTPEAIVISAFDPVRREICRLALHQLVADGRIHPARIEEVVAKVKKQLDNEIIETGKRTAIDLGIHGLHPELIRIVGKMKYRSSYGQNLLQHARETANLCAVMASELGLNPKKAKRAGLLHDIGKVPDEETDLPHALYGGKIAEKYKEKPDICNAIAAHHDEVEMTTLLAPIVQVCDAISGARPGARREIVEAYIKRLNDLEAIAMSYPGVTKTYAIQAGRELRVIVGADKMDDAESEKLSSEIAEKIQNEMTYPGQVKITVIREIRSVAYAK